MTCSTYQDRRGKVDLHKERTSIAEVVKRAAETTQPLFQERQQPLALDVPGDLFVEGDPTRLQQVFANLLTNASKHSDPGTGVGVSAKPVGDRVEIRVRDHGIGIRPEMIERVFDLFVQQPQALDRAAGGLGLGLAIVKNLVASHGGSVRVESDGPGTGSEFIVTLPSMPAAGDAARPAATGVAAAAPRGSPACRVLVVDDSEDGAAMLADSLESMGHDVRVAHDGREALDAAAVFHPDVAVLDIGLPEMSGYELAAHLREQPGGRAMRFIAATGYGRSRDRVKSLAAGFDDHLVKPVNLDRLRIVAQAATAKATRADRHRPRSSDGRPVSTEQRWRGSKVGYPPAGSRKRRLPPLSLDRRATSSGSGAAEQQLLRESGAGETRHEDNLFTEGLLTRRR